MPCNSSALHVMSVVGARPNFMKIAPLAHAIRRHNDTPAGGNRPISHTLVHTGQHYDKAMSESFFDLLDIPRPDVDLEVGSGSHAWQVGQTMIRLEAVMNERKPDWVVVVGDVNATCAAAINAKKNHIRLAHVEAGLRSFDRTMPEEINRIVTDALADLLLTYDEEADANLLREGVAPERIFRAGNVMIDTLDHQLPSALRLDINAVVRANLCEPGGRNTSIPQLRPDGFALLTLHRPSNVDERDTLVPIVRYLTEEFCPHMPLVWTLHPRTSKQMRTFGVWEAVVASPNLLLVNPLNYLEMLCLNRNARLVFTDSGVLQEECCVLGTPCVTLRENTERPVTLRENGGVSVLAGNSPDKIRSATAELLTTPRRSFRPPLWDGHAADRMIQRILNG